MSSPKNTISKRQHNDVFLAMVPQLWPIVPNKPINFAFSPLSLRALVSLIAAGASGPPLQQLLSFLDAPSIHDVNARSLELLSSVFADGGGPKLSFANALWFQEGLSIKHSFNQAAKDVYKASSYQADFINTDVIIITPFPFPSFLIFCGILWIMLD